MSFRTRFLTAAMLAAACATPEAAKKADTLETAAKPVVVAADDAAKVAAEKAKAEAEAAAAKKVHDAILDATKPVPPGLDATVLNPAVDPCDDFYEFACGGWLAKTEIPADRSINSRGFVAIADQNEANLKAILEDAAANKLPKDAPFAKQLGDSYATCMDDKGLEKGLAAVQKFMKANTSPKNAEELAKIVGTLHAAGLKPLFDMGAMQDLKKADQVIAGLDQGGLGLPDRDYYTEAGPAKDDIRKAYVTFIETMLVKAGESPVNAKKMAADAMELETRLAKVSQTRVERRDPMKLYNRIERKGLKTDAAAFPWDTYFTALGAPAVEAVNVNAVGYFKEIAAIATDAKVDQWHSYLSWVVLRNAVPGLPKSFQETAFEFTSKNFTGAKEDRPRWKKCVGYVDNDLGEALGQEFARRHFPADSKARTSAMIEALQGAVVANLNALPWLDESTKKAALVKAQRMVANNKIGYPDKWRDYSAMKTTRNSYFENMLASSRFEVARQLAKIGKPVDRTEWLMSPPTVNAYYDPQKNEIVFPAGILQPPFFNKDATDAVNFGSMGIVVGHEVSHGFDDEGRQFDVEGNLQDWWTASVSKAFDEKAKCVKEQYDGYTGVEGLKINGALTMGENIADLGGVKLSHAAMEQWYAKKDASEETKYRFTPSQQFFLGFSQSWCTKVRPENAKLRLQTDPHSPAMFRVNGPLSNSDAFRKAFACPATSKMVRTGAKQCVVF